MTTTADTFETIDVVRLLGELISDNDLGPGDRLPPIRELALTFGVKAGAVRDALSVAQPKRLMKVLSRVWAIVHPEKDSPAAATVATNSFVNVVGQPDQNLYHVLETREALELTMVGKAAERRELSELFRLRQILADLAEIPLEGESPEYARLDVEFHLELGCLFGNAVMASLLRVRLVDVRPHLDRIRWSDNRRAESNEQHARIYAALAEGDAEQAQWEMREHIRAAYNKFLNEMREPRVMNGDRSKRIAS